MPESQGIWFVLDKLTADIKSLDERSERQIELIARLAAEMKGVSEQLRQVSKTLNTGNGGVPIVVQLSELKKDAEQAKVRSEILDTKIESLQALIEDRLSDEAVIIQTSKVKQEKWKTVAKFVGLLSLAGPGIVSLLAQWLT